jgi:hypothetical protein
MKFTINSQPATAIAENSPVGRAIKVIEAMKDGELLDVRGVAALLDRCPEYLRDTLAQCPAHIRAKGLRNGFLYGNPKTIAAWKKERAAS